MRTIGLSLPNMLDATSFYRALGPFSQIRREAENMQLHFLDNVTWGHLSMCDAVFLQRGMHNSHREVAEVIIRNGLPLWVDYDDDLFCVPEYNPNFALFNRKEIQKNIADIIAMANVVTVSTAKLAEKFSLLSKNIIVIPNALNDRLTYGRRDKSKEQRKLIMWRGSNTHRLDLNLASEAVLSLSREFAELTWLFIGDRPWFADMIPPTKVIVSPALDPSEYFDMLRELPPAIAIVPLVDCEFNHSKSNCAWIEATFAGAAVLAPDWTEWQKPGISHYNQEIPFGVALRNMILRIDSLFVEEAESWDYIKRNLTLSAVNELRSAILEDLIPCKMRKRS